MNKISATGRLGSDAELKHTTSSAVLSFSLASDVGFGDKKTTNWFRCQIWGKRGEALAPHLVKGQQVTVFGTLTLREWENKDGIKQISPDLNVDEIELMGGRSNGQTAQGGIIEREVKSMVKATNPLDEDIPF